MRFGHIDNSVRKGFVKYFQEDIPDRKPKNHLTEVNQFDEDRNF